ncbi:hypothetical protein Nepgr_023902 [Nepenthes gracilis]|uniref:Uncharacterized protein n=1 Tax=Nepenthes gracilis TaxID=150966 RepID=A0AAD3T3L6_NEPGR|nr:hypothetical protein Nepgr_023902 [Nepenthes gracilis]
MAKTPTMHMDEVLSLGVVTILSVMLYAKMLTAVMLVRGLLMECRVQLIGAMRLVLWPRLLCRDVYFDRGVFFLQTLAAGNLEVKVVLPRLGHDALTEIVGLDAF